MNFKLRACVVLAIAGVLAACTDESNVNPLPGAPDASDGSVDAVADTHVGDAPSCVATFDFSDVGMAHVICDRDPNCVVCVQTVDAQGKPTTWLAQQNASACPCPKPGVEAADGGPDAAPDAPADTGPDALADGAADGPTDALPDAQCVATFDIGDKSTAVQICGSDPNCAVCVQKVDAQGNATTWLAQRNAPSCPCPTPAGP